MSKRASHGLQSLPLPLFVRHFKHQVLRLITKLPPISVNMVLAAVFQDHQYTVFLHELRGSNHSLSWVRRWELKCLAGYNVAKRVSTESKYFWVTVRQVLRQIF